jgi:hypothetical protein
MIGRAGVWIDHRVNDVVLGIYICQTCLMMLAFATANNPKVEATARKVNIYLVNHFYRFVDSDIL